MTTAPGGVAVIATQLAQTDRRALSEAWYSALHLAHDGAPPRTARVRGSAAPAVTARSAAEAMRAETAPREGTMTPLRGQTAKALHAVSGERRRPANDATRRITRAVAALAARRPLPATHTVEVEGGRVRLLIHTDGRAMRVVALCSAALREPVERALASARFTLAGAGVTVAAP